MELLVLINKSLDTAQAMMHATSEFNSWRWAMSQIQSWEVSDALWERVAPLVPRPERDPEKTYRRKLGAGRKPLNPRQVFSGILYVLRTGSQWKALPKERFGSPSSVHGYFREWLIAGFFLNLWKAGLAEYDELKGIEWSCLSIDGSMVKAPMARDTVGRNPTDRGKKRDQAPPLGGRLRRTTRRSAHGSQPS